MDKAIASSLNDFAEKNFIKPPQIVGGYVRDIVLGRELSSPDIDLTTNNSDITRLAVGFAAEYGYFFKVFEDLHTTIYLDQKKNLDFSSNFNSKKAIDFFKNSNFSDKKYYEVISRDFSINTLHMDISSSNIIDMLSIGLKDIEDKVIKPVSNAEICFSDDPRRIYRAAALSAKLNFRIDKSIVKFAVENKELFSINNPAVKDSYILSTLEKAIGFNDDLLIDNLISLNVLKNVPLIGRLKDLLIAKNRINTYLDMQSNLY